MMHKQPHNDTTNPPGQIVNLEVPLTRAIEAFKDDQLSGASPDYLNGYKHGQEDALKTIQNVRQELKRLREQNVKLYLEASQYKAIVEKHTKFA